MPVRQSTLLASLLILLGMGATARPVQAQALLPYVLPLDESRLESDGISLAQDAAQLAQFQQFEEALARAELAAQLAPNDAQVLSLLGSLQLQLGQTAAAIPTLEKAKRLERDNPLVWFALGSAYFSEGKYLQSVDSLEMGLDLEPENAGARFDLGNAYYRLTRYQQAIEQYEAAVRYEETLWPAVNNIGLVLYEQGNVEGAIAKWRESLVVSPEEQSEPQLAIAVALYAQGNQRRQAVDQATVALERDSRYADIDFLEENLWGSRLIDATKVFFATPDLQDLLAQL
ncbi:MAG: tetratricopeptide repeat protein [Cyanobacteria bacterium P01_A01_bin.105]